jgi:hypothetical protein
MQRIIPLLLLLAFVSGCANQGFKRGSGDAGEFIIERVVSYGGAPLTTKNLPRIPGAWRYAEDANGVGIRMPYNSCGAVEQFFKHAFGTTHIEARQGARFGEFSLGPKGGAIQFTCDDAGTQVIVLRPRQRK